MLYKRSAFLQLLVEKYECQTIPLSSGRTIKIVNGPSSAFMHLDGRDVIDYEEIYLIYQKLYLSDLPGDRDLVRVE